MELKQILRDDDAVSPVIGVILMVAITVILAAVIGTFVLGLGKNIQTTAPTASITFDHGVGNSNEVQVSHEGGETLKPGQISIVFEDADGGVSVSNPDNEPGNWAGDSEISAGDTEVIKLSGAYESGDVIKVVWTSDGGETSSVIGDYEVP